ncbi:vacuolar protein sorting-associated protein 37A-like isoform X2 [Dysidea avara]|uniref:vacuolar protein sorting-associated protein 37A-like isoform X2 n=1 Tax=Dysidea avara TaxID=196820 RepID=UPI0033216945
MTSFFTPWKSSSSKYEAPKLPTVTSAEKQRSRQVEWLRKDVNGLIEIQLNVRYQVEVKAGGNELYLVIHLPPGFPKDPPELSVIPPITHPWVDDQCRVIGSPLLKNFTMHESIGRAVNQVIKEFIEHPPRLKGSETQTYIPPTDTTHSTTLNWNVHSSQPVHDHYDYHYDHTVTNNTTSSQEERHRYKAPPLPVRFSDIQDFSDEKLEHFLHDIEGVIEVDQYISKLSIVKKIKEDRGKILAQNESQARMNLSHEPNLEKSWDELQEKFLLLQALREQFNGLHDEHQKYLKKYQRSKVIAQLGSAAQEIEHKTEQLTENFLQKKITVDEFLNDYLTDRKLYYLRQGKQARLRERHN